MVWRGHAFPHSTKPDLFLLFDRKRQRPVPFPSDFRCFGQGAEGIFSAAQLEKIAHRKGKSAIELHAIVTLGKHDQHFSGHPHGPLAFKLRQLHLLGHRSYPYNSLEPFYLLIFARCLQQLYMIITFPLKACAGALVRLLLCPQMWGQPFLPEKHSQPTQNLNDKNIVVRIHINRDEFTVILFLFFTLGSMPLVARACCLPTLPHHKSRALKKVEEEAEWERTQCLHFQSSAFLDYVR